MIIPKSEAELKKFLQFVVDQCTSSQMDRRALYEKRRRYFLYGCNEERMVRFNRLGAHIPLLGSFLFAGDQAAYTVAAPKNADEKDVAAHLAIEDDWNETFQDDGLADCFDQALQWAIVYDTMVLKQGWNDTSESQFCQLVEPSSFGVMREDTWDFSAQQAMVHTFYIDYDDAVERMLRAGKADQIEKLPIVSGGGADLGLPGTLGAMIIASTGGANIQGPMTGTVNPDYEASPSFSARNDQPMVRFHEVWVWDSAFDDFRTFHIFEPDVIISDSVDTIKALKSIGNLKGNYGSESNLFLPKENPFTMLTPYPMYNNIWGYCHLEQLIPLQQWSNERLVQIGEILEQQVDPAKVFSGFMGMDDERAEALGGPGTWMADQMPGAKVERLQPQMPEDLFREFEEIGGMFMQQSGFTEIMAGRGEKNVRGRGHARELKNTGGGSVRKVAAGLERPLVRLGDIGLRLMARNSDESLKTEDGFEFVPAQVIGNGKYTMRIAGHSHSPLFTSDATELAFALRKSQAINNEWLLRTTRPPQMANLLHSLKKTERVQAKMAQDRAAQGIPPQGQQKKPHVVK